MIHHGVGVSLPGHGGIVGTMKREGTLRSPYAALYIWKAANSALHSSSSGSGFWGDMKRAVVLGGLMECGDR